MRKLSCYCWAGDMFNCRATLASYLYVSLQPQGSKGAGSGTFLSPQILVKFPETLEEEGLRSVSTVAGKKQLTGWFLKFLFCFIIVALRKPHSCMITLKKELWEGGGAW